MGAVFVLTGLVVLWADDTRQRYRDFCYFSYNLIAGLVTS